MSALDRCEGSGARVALTEQQRAAKRAACPRCELDVRVRVGRGEGGPAATIPHHKPKGLVARRGAAPLDADAAFAWGVPVRLSEVA